MKNKHTKFRIIGGGISLIGIILGLVAIILAANHNTGPAMGVLLAIGIGILLFGIIFYAVATNNSRKYCDKCGSSMKGCAWEYNTVSATSSSSSNGDVYDHYKIHIRAKCPSCGAVKEYDEKFSCKSGENIEFKIDNYMRNKFGD